MRALSRLLHPSTSTACSIVLVASVYLLTLCLLEKRGLWIVDNANKLLQVQAISTSNYSDYSIPWPGTTVDPDFEFNPIPRRLFSEVHNGKLFSIYSPVFATMSSFPFRLLGYWGLYILPAVSSLLMLVGLARIANVMGLQPTVRHTMVLLAGLCTPLWFYSVVFWEHTVAICLFIWGIASYLQFFKTRSNKCLILGSALMAFSIYFRDELYLLCAVIVGVTFFLVPANRWKTALIAIFSMIIGLLPLWLFQWTTIGHPFGFHVRALLFTATGIAEHLSARPTVFYNLFVASNPHVWISLTLTTPFLITFLLNPKFSRRAFILAVPLYSVVALVSALVALKGYLAPGSPISWMLQSNSLFTTAPILMLAFLRLKDSGGSRANQSMARWIWVVALVYAVIHGLAAPKASSWGIHWGNRFLVVLYPLFALLAAINLAEWFAYVGKRIDWRCLVTVAAIVISCAAQVYSIRILHKKKEFSYHLNKEVKGWSEKVVITDVWWVPQALFSEFYNKLIFLVRSREEYRRLLGRLRDHGYERYVFVSQTFSEDVGRAVMKVDDEGLEFFSIKFLVAHVPDTH